jgi:hypothetical protein
MGFRGGPSADQTREPAPRCVICRPSRFSWKRSFTDTPRRRGGCLLAVRPLHEQRQLLPSCAPGLRQFRHLYVDSMLPGGPRSDEVVSTSGDLSSHLWTVSCSDASLRESAGTVAFGT